VPIRAFQGRHDRQAELPGYHIAPCVLPNLSRLPENIQEVVGKLERDTEIDAILAHAQAVRLRCTDAHGPQPARRPEKPRGLPTRDIQAVRLSEFERTDARESRLRTGHVVHNLRHDLHVGPVANVGEFAVCAGRQVVADQDGDAVAKELPDRGLPAAHVGLIHHVIVHEARQVQHFETHRDVHRRRIRFAKDPRAEQRDKRAQTLAPGLNRGQRCARYLVASVAADVTERGFNLVSMSGNQSPESAEGVCGRTAGSGD